MILKSIRIGLLWACVVGIFACSKDNRTVEPISEPTKTEPPVTVPVVITELDRPINLKATKGSFGTNIVVTWTPMPLAKKYQLFKFFEADQQYKLLKETSDTTFTDITSIPLIKNFYKVKIYNSTTEYSQFSDVDYGYTSGQTYSKVLSFGSEGTGTAQFMFPTNVEVDASGFIYVSDENYPRTQKFDPTGKYIEDYYKPSGASGTRGMVFMGNGNVVVVGIKEGGANNLNILDADKKLITSFGPLIPGGGDGNFGNTRQVCVDDEKNIYVVDQNNNRIQKFDQNGKFLSKFGATGSSPLKTPWGVCYVKNKIYVTSTVSNIVNVYDKAGNYIKSLNTGGPGYCIKSDGENLFIGSAGYVIKTDLDAQIIEKLGQGQFSGVVGGVALNSTNDLVVTDVYARKVLVFKKL